MKPLLLRVRPCEFSEKVLNSESPFSLPSPPCYFSEIFLDSESPFSLPPPPANFMRKFSTLNPRSHSRPPAFPLSLPFLTPPSPPPSPPFHFPFSERAVKREDLRGSLCQAIGRHLLRVLQSLRHPFLGRQPRDIHCTCVRVCVY